ncbi:MAG: hypothetical protein QOI48_3160 [Solirubrobacteraceae bacterium]|jgi:DNA-binding transcriptional LysR family regulator|nr:hypothetical protein [Solirubrobacteraceae bacterium]
MEFRQLLYFVAVAEELHFGRAADRLHIVQPAVSQQIRRLEAELGIALLDRSTRRVTLTIAGQRLLPEARAVLKAVENARQSVADVVAERAMTLRLGTSTGLGERLPRVLAEFRARVPDQAVELVGLPVQERLAQTAGGGLDAALVRGVASHPGLCLQPVWEDLLVVVLPATHPLAKHPRVTLSQLAELPLRIVAREVNPPLVDLLLAACRSAGFEPRQRPAARQRPGPARRDRGRPRNLDGLLHRPGRDAVGASSRGRLRHDRPSPSHAHLARVASRR